MPKRKSRTPEEQAQKFREERERAGAGLPTIADAEDEVDERIKKNIREYGRRSTERKVAFASQRELPSKLEALGQRARAAGPTDVTDSLP